jgi:hypothetical protein
VRFAQVLRSGVAAWAFFFFPCLSLAQWDTSRPIDLTVTAPGRVAGAPGPSDFTRLVSRTHLAGGSPGSVEVRELLSRAPGPRGDLAVTATRALPWAALSKGAARTIPVLGTALLINDILDAAGVRVIPSSDGFGWKLDPGVGTVQGVCWRPKTGSDVCVQSALAAVTIDKETRALAFVYPNFIRYTAGPSCTRANPVSDPNRYMCSYSQETGFSYPNGTQVVTGIASLGGEYMGELGGEICPGFGNPNVPETYVPEGLPPEADGKCKTGQHTQPISNDEVEDRLIQWGDKSRAVPLAIELDRLRQPVDHPTPILSGPESVPAGRETTTNPDGSVTIRDTDHPITYTPEPGYGWEDRRQTTTYPPGATIPPPGTTPPAGTPPPTTTTAPPEFKTCGLPGQPPCKIDEGGTPPPLPPGGSPFGDPDGPLGSIRAAIDNPQVANTAWTFSFALPTGCTAIATPALAPWLTSIDVCPYQPMIHDIMSVVWLMATVWAAISMVGLTLGRT